jgi:hypothetical protein
VRCLYCNYDLSEKRFFYARSRGWKKCLVLFRVVTQLNHLNHLPRSTFEENRIRSCRTSAYIRSRGKLSWSDRCISIGRYLYTQIYKHWKMSYNIDSGTGILIIAVYSCNYGPYIYHVSCTFREKMCNDSWKVGNVAIFVAVSQIWFQFSVSKYSLTDACM